MISYTQEEFLEIIKKYNSMDRKTITINLSTIYKKKEMIKLGSLNIQIASNGIGSGSVVFNDICTDNIIIKLENAESVNHWHHIVALTSVGITYKNVETDTTILQDIVKEENVHVGQLEQLLKTFSVDAHDIDKGEQEAEEQLSK